MNSTQLRPLIAAATLALALPLACGGKNKKSQPTAGTGTPAKPASGLVLLQNEDLPDGLAFRLSHGAQKADAAAPRTVVKGTPLSDAEVKTILARMSPIKRAADDQKAFALRDRSQPPPRTGRDVKKPFPPPPGADAPPVAAVPKGDLEVLRYQPDGDVPIAPHLSITFSQPMVAITSHDDTVAKGVPVKLSPTPKGNWRWVGSKTLMFDPDVRFPQATKYRVTIPKGTKSATGGALAKEVAFDFTTPPPRMIRSWPAGNSQPLRPVLYLAFDQKIDPKAVLATIEVRAGKRKVPVRLATAAEIEKDETVAGLVSSADAQETGDRDLVLAFDADLPKDTRISIQVGPGTPSAEGPRKTTSAQSFSFRTYGPLKLVRARCWAKDCPPGQPWHIEFTNQLDAEAFEEASIAIDPELPARNIFASGRAITIRGMARGRTSYKVVVPASLKDVFGQTLGTDEEVEFQVGSARPWLWGPSGLVVLDPSARKPTLDLFSTNFDKLKVQLYQVDPRKDWVDFVRFMRDWNNRHGIPGKKVVDTVVAVKGTPDVMSESSIDLSPALSGNYGHVVAMIEPTPWTQRGQPPRLKVWLQATDIGLDAFVDNQELIAWSTRLSDGAALPGVKLEIAPQGTTAASGLDGTTAIKLPKQRTKGPNVLLATQGADTAFLPENQYSWSGYGGWHARGSGEPIRWFVFDDRQMYRPGEKVHLKGWMRKVDFGEGGDVSAQPSSLRSVAYKVIGSRGNDLAKGTAPVSALGGFDFAIELPKTPNLGYARVELSAGGSRHYHSFQIQEFRRPEFEVTAQASKGPHIVGTTAQITAKAAYYAGGPLPGAATRWTVNASPTSFTPPNRDDYIFGVFVPWWRYYHDDQSHNSYETFQAKTDASGSHVLDIALLSVKPPRPMQLSANVAVTDVNRQEWAASAALLVHPSELYVGLKSKKMFVDKGTPIDIDAIVVDHDGKAIAGREVTLRAARMDYKWTRGKYEEIEQDPQACTLTSTSDAETCSFQTGEGGRYKIEAVVADDAGRPNRTELTVWVAGGGMPPARDVTQEEVLLIPDKKEYAPGDTARILLQAPFHPAEAVISQRRSGIVSYRRVQIDGPSKVLEIPIEDRHTPNLYLQVDLVGSTARLDDKGEPAPSLPKRPAYAVGSINLPVPPHHRTLEVSAEPRQRVLEPGGKTTVEVSVRDARGKPVAGAEVALVVVDEAILSLTNYQLGDIVGTFYPQRPAGASDYHLRQYVKLARPDDIALAGNNEPMDQTAGGEGRSYDFADDAGGDTAVAEEAAPAAPGMTRSRSTRSKNGGGGQASQPIAVRSNFDPLATFAPKVKTNGKGQASVAIELPDNLTRYRVMAIAVDKEKQFGKGEANITARMPLMVRPSPPRFLNFGDRFELPVVLQNQTDKAMEVAVAVRAANAELKQNGLKVTVPANDRIEVRFPAAAEMPGTARLQIAASSGSAADAAELSLPVWTPATTEAFATYGVIDKGAIKQPVAMPGKVVTEFGGLEITTSSTQLHALTDAFLYLIAYDFECSEQLASRILAVAALRDVLGAFETEGLPEPAEIEAAMKRDMDKIAALQNYDGGFAFWRRGDQSWPYLSIHVAHALARAQAKGYSVPSHVVERSKRYLQQIENRIPGYYSPEARRTLIAYALYVRKLMKDPDPARARKLLAEGKGIKERSLEAVGWILSVLTGDAGSKKELAQIRRHLRNRATETAGTAHFVTGYSDGAHLLLHSSRRADGIILEALIDDQPKNTLIPKIVRGLLAHRTRGRWSNTQENAFVLLAMDRYFHEYEKATPNFVARAWLGSGLALEHTFKGRSTDRVHVDVPMSYLAKQKQADLVLQKKGTGRLYYRVGMRYAPASLKLDPADHGFAVTRSYEAVDDPDDVTRKADGSWEIKAGAKVRVRVTMVAESRRYHVALVDPLPAGLEPMNPALAVTGAIPQDPGQQKRGYWWWQRSWYEHQNMRDERVEAFTSLLWEGVHEYSYVARATTPGSFVVPPAKAEEMYHPETFGRSGSDRVVVR